MSSSLIAPPEPAAAQHGPLPVIVLPRPFSMDRTILRLPQGLRLSEILLEAGIVPDGHLRVWIDDWLIPQEMWPVVRPRAGRMVTVRAVPGMGGGGSGGGSGQKSTGRLIGTILIAILAVAVAAVVTIYAPPLGAMLGITIGPVVAGLIGAAAGAAVSIGGALLLNAIVPIQQPKLDAMSQPGGQALAASPTYSLQGARNRMAVYAKVPRPYGWHRITPPYAAEPITELVGADQYLTLVFCLGYGPMLYHRPRIGDEPLENFDGVTVEWRAGYPSDPPLTLYLGDQHEEPLSLPLGAQGTLIRTTQPGVTRISADYVFPRGVGRFNPQDGNLGEYEAGVGVMAEYRLQGTTTWSGFGPMRWHNGPTRDIIRGTFQVDVTAGTYEVTVWRQSPDSPDQYVIDDVFWTALRSQKFTNTINLHGLALFALRIKAGDQLQGVVDTFNVEVESILPDWNGSAWVERPTRNPAAVWRNILQGTATRQPVPDARLNLPALQDWHAFCVAKKYNCDLIVDYETTVKQLLDDVSAVGLASTTLDSNGKYSVVRDLPQVTPVQLLTPRNSWGFSGSKAFPDKPHGFRVRYMDGNPVGPVTATSDATPAIDASWEIEETTVYAPGYHAGNATLFESLEFRGVTAHHQAVGLAKYHQRVVDLRPEIWQINCDVENLVCTRGDLVRVAHDVLHAGLGWGRVQSHILSGPNALGFVSDEAIFTEMGKTYRVLIRGPHGDQVWFSIVATGTVSTTVTFTSPQPATTIGAPGDLFSWGETFSESIPAMVKAIQPGPDLTARLTLVPYSDLIYAYDSDEPYPPYVPQISRAGTPPPFQGPGAPAAPLIYIAYSDETTLVFGPGGSVQPFIVVGLQYIPKAGAPDQAPEFVVLEVQISFWTLDSWMHVKTVPGSTTTIGIENVTAGNVYDIRIRTVAGRQASTWTLWQGVVVYGRTTRPPDVPIMAPSGRSIRWAYPDAPVDMAGFRLRRHFGTRTVWEDAQPLHDGLLSSTVSVFPIDLYDQTATYLLKAVNTSGLESLNAITLAVHLPSGVVFGDRLVVNLLDTIDLKALGFPGTVTGGTLVGGNLEASTVGLYWSGGDAALFWHDAADPAWADQYGAMTYVFSVLPDADQVPCSITVILNATALAHSLEYRTGGSALYWSPSGASAYWTADPAPFWPSGSGGEGWVPWPGTIQALTRLVHEFRLITAPGPVKGIVDLLSVDIDVPDIREHFEDFAIAGTTGTRLPITRSYRAIKIVNATLQNDAGSAVLISIEDKGSGGPPLTLGPLLKAWDILGMGGTPVAGTADVEIIGY